MLPYWFTENPTNPKRNYIFSSNKKWMQRSDINALGRVSGKASSILRRASGLNVLINDIFQPFLFSTNLPGLAVCQCKIPEVIQSQFTVFKFSTFTGIERGIPFFSEFFIR